MKKQVLLLCSFAVAMLSSTHVLASTIFDFSFTGNSSVTGSPGNPFSGAGQFTATQVGTSYVYKVTHVTGTTDGQAITALIPVGGFGFNDNLLTFKPGDSSAVLDNSGVSYQLANGVDVNLFLSTNGGDAQLIFGFPGFLLSEEQSADVTVTPHSIPSAVPEPATIALFGTGALGFIGSLRRRLST
jgi:hypothetical protein